MSRAVDSSGLSVFILFFAVVAILLGGMIGVWVLYVYLVVDDAPQVVVTEAEVRPSGLHDISAVHLKLDGADVPHEPGYVKLASGGRMLENECPTASAPCFLVDGTPDGVPVDGVAVRAGSMGKTYTVIPTADGRTCVAEYWKYGKCSQYNMAGQPTIASGVGKDTPMLGLGAAVALVFGIFAIVKFTD